MGLLCFYLLFDDLLLCIFVGDCVCLIMDCLKMLEGEVIEVGIVMWLIELV